MQTYKEKWVILSYDPLESGDLALRHVVELWKEGRSRKAKVKLSQLFDGMLETFVDLLHRSSLTGYQS